MIFVKHEYNCHSILITFYWIYIVYILFKDILLYIYIYIYIYIFDEQVADKTDWLSSVNIFFTWNI